MKVKYIVLAFWFIIMLTSNISGQTIIKPNIGLKSHETLVLNKIELRSDITIASFTIENKITDGSFCADKNISIIYPDGSRIKTTKATGIPRCPEVYKFKYPGEKLQFTLEFPPLRSGTKWIDIVEECASNCFWFYGVTLDNELNNKLDDAFVLAEKGEPAKNILLFRNILESVDKQNEGIEGSLYVNIIVAAVEAGDKVEAAVWYKRLVGSAAPRKSEYIRFLNSKGIKF
jgi:hypothetical protein